MRNASRQDRNGLLRYKIRASIDALSLFDYGLKEIVIPGIDRYSALQLYGLEILEHPARRFDSKCIYDFGNTSCENYRCGYIGKREPKCIVLG